MHRNFILILLCALISLVLAACMPRPLIPFFHANHYLQHPHPSANAPAPTTARLSTSTPTTSPAMTTPKEPACFSLVVICSVVQATEAHHAINATGHSASARALKGARQLLRRMSLQLVSRGIVARIRLLCCYLLW